MVIEMFIVYPPLYGQYENQWNHIVKKAAW